ncbi:MAG: DUF1552 domain-containing protein [Acidobacteria bacterium]|nr:DUF1552 domain-containing protein [Acidobacteriota bacterium]
MTRKALSRRTLLRGLGTAIALPALDAMAPAMNASKIPGKAPVRMAFVYVPNGLDMRHWTPAEDGAFPAELPRILRPMDPLRQDFNILSNLTQNNGRALLDGAGDHGRCCGAYLTGMHPKKSAVDIKAGISCDQIVANQTGSLTRFPSLQLGIEDARQAGDCDSGYSCAYTNNLSWRSETQPLPPILDPRAFFEHLFGKGTPLTPEARARQAKYRKSVLDFVTADTKKLQGDLGPTDRRKLDEYLSSIREIEKQLEKAEKDERQIEPGMPKPFGIPADFAEHFKLMSDMITVAFQADISRVVTFLVTREGTSRPYREIGIADGHHPLTHHQGKMDLLDKVTRINEYHMVQFAAWMQRLKAIQEGDSNILDNSMIVYGAGLSDGNRHTHEDLPVLVAGKGGNRFKGGRRITYRKETPISNLYLTMMDRMGVNAEHFGDATGRAGELDMA